MGILLLMAGQQLKHGSNDRSTPLAKFKCCGGQKHSLDVGEDGKGGKIMEEDNIKKVFGENFTAVFMGRMYVIIAHLMLVCLNTYSIVSRFFKLPPRDPFKPMNEASYLIAWFELIGAGIGLLMLSMGIVMVFITAVPNSMDLICWGIRLLKSFSAIMCIDLIVPTNVVDSFKSDQVIGSILALIGRSALGMCGVFALVNKIATLSFVNMELYSDWSYAQWVVVLAFVNNVLSMIGSSIDENKMRTTMRFLGCNSEQWITEKLMPSLEKTYMPDGKGASLQKFKGRITILMIRLTLKVTSVQDLFS